MAYKTRKDLQARIDELEEERRLLVEALLDALTASHVIDLQARIDELEEERRLLVEAILDALTASHVMRSDPSTAVRGGGKR